MKNPDILDQAQEVTNFITERHVEHIRAQAQPEKHPDFDGQHCVEEECGVAIPAERLALGKIRCVDCAELRERQRRGDAKVW